MNISSLSGLYFESNCPEKAMRMLVWNRDRCSLVQEGIVNDKDDESESCRFWSSFICSEASILCNVSRASNDDDDDDDDGGGG